MPRELVMGDTQLQEQMQAHVRQFMAGKDSAMQERIVLEPNLDPEAKFLSHACLPRVYAESWTRQVARHYQQLPKESEFVLKRTPRPKHDGAFCCVVESPTSLLVVMADGKTEKVPPRTWLMLEPPPSAFRTRPSATVSPEGEADLEAFVTSFGTCLLSGAAGGGWLEGQPGISMLRTVPESRLHGKAAEATFQRVSHSSSIVALRHAALIAELLADTPPPGANSMNRRLKYAFPPLEVQEAAAAAAEAAERALPLLRVPAPDSPLPPPQDRPFSPLTPPPWPQFLKTEGVNPAAAGWAAPEEEDQLLSPAPRSDVARSSPTRHPSASRPTSVESAACRSARLEAMVTSRTAASDRCAQSARNPAQVLDSESHKALQASLGYGQKSTLQKGFQALLDFLEFTNRRYGNPVRTWFVLDPEANMKLGARQFERKCMEIGFRGNIPALWKYIDKSGDGVITLLELHTLSALELARFKLLIRERFKDSMADAFRYLDSNHSGRVNRVMFVARMQTARYAGKAGRLFDLLDRPGLGMLTIQNLSFLETWRMPTYLYHQPDPTRWKAVKDKLMEVHRNALKAWRKLDKDGSMRLSYEEFRDIAADLASKMASSPSNGSLAFPRTESEVAAAWRAIDKECVGYIQLRDWDLASHRNLSEFKSWCDRNHGGVIAAFRFLDGGGMEKNSNAKLSEHELRNCTKGPDPCTADIEFLFDGLDVNGHWALSESDVQFLDQWDFEWEQWQEEAAAKKRQQLRASSP